MHYLKWKLCGTFSKCSTKGQTKKSGATLSFRHSFFLHVGVKNVKSLSKILEIKVVEIISPLN